MRQATRCAPALIQAGFRAMLAGGLGSSFQHFAETRLISNTISGCKPS
jgi:hypothetical protein